MNEVMKKKAKEMGVNYEQAKKHYLEEKGDKHLNLMQMVKKYGYPIERHQYTTEDNYTNTVFRISGPRGTNAEDNSKWTKKRPVILY